jgi:hypothetical protein
LLQRLSMKAIAVLFIALTGCSGGTAHCDSIMLERDPATGACILEPVCPDVEERPVVEQVTDSGECNSLGEQACRATTNCCADYTFGPPSKAVPNNPFLACKGWR